MKKPLKGRVKGEYGAEWMLVSCSMSTYKCKLTKVWLQQSDP